MIKKTSENPTPVYFRLQMELKTQIEEGRWSPGQKIPTERELAKNYELSIGTVKKAILNLVNDGYLYRIQGKGTFVAGTTLRRGSLRYYRLLENFGDKEADLTVKLLDLKQIKGNPVFNKTLKIDVNQDLYEVKRLILCKNKPIIYCISYLPRKSINTLDRFRNSLLENMTLYKLLEEEYSIITVYNQMLFSTIDADAGTAELLKVKNGTPLLLVDMVSFTYKDTPYELRKSYCITDQRKVFVEF
jgi:GntR family transcriptional regulator